jgi:hypothetical protein
MTVGALLPALAISQTTPLDTTTNLTAVGTQNASQGTVFTLHATVADSHGPVPYGSVTFYNGDPSVPTASLGTVVINKATGIATLRTGSFTVGTHSITAKFTGTNNDAPSASSNVDLTVTAKQKYASSVTLHPLLVNGRNELSAWVVGNAPLPLDGTVTFTDTTTNTVLGTASLNLPLLRTGFSATINATNIGGSIVPPTDFNNDGNLDLLSEYLYFLPGRGDGTFGSPVYVHSPAYVYGTAAAVGDLNNDGKLDVVASCRPYPYGGLQSICVLLGNGDGTFQAPQVYTANQTPQSIAIADLNGDGRQDFVVGWQGTDGFDGGLTLFTNHSDGKFQSQEIYNQSTVQVSVADFNVDNKLDLIVGTGRTPPQVLFGHGNGTFTLAASDSNLAPNAPFVIGDFNGDGKPDVGLFDYNYGMYGAFEVGLGHGDGTFETSHFNSSNYYVAGKVGDFSGDGKLDLFILETASYSNGAIFLGHGDGTFSVEPQSVSNFYGFLAPLTGDLNNDGVIDLTSESINWYKLAQPNATAGAAYTGPLPNPTDKITATYNGNDVFATSTSAPINPVVQQ